MLGSNSVAEILLRCMGLVLGQPELSPTVSGYNWRFLRTSALGIRAYFVKYEYNILYKVSQEYFKIARGSNKVSLGG